MQTRDNQMTEEEYLLREPEAEYKSEYRDGRVVAMGGASPAHSVITANILSSIHGQLKGRPCRVYTSDTRVKVASARFYTYPDVSVVCGEPLFDRQDTSALLNPTVIVEVLSPSTEAYDRGMKFEYYKKLSSLREYVLAAQDETRVERFVRQGNGEWTAQVLGSTGDSLPLDAIDCRIEVRDIYDKV